MVSVIRKLRELLERDPRYKAEAYEFVREALAYAQETLAMGVARETEEPPKRTESKRPKSSKSAARKDHHLTGQQLCEAIRLYAQEQYGLLAKTVLNNWGLRTTGDFGEVVFNLIEIGLMKKSKSDCREDFDDRYDFDDAFVKGFRISVLR